jgi:hypothetical protein
MDRVKDNSKLWATVLQDEFIKSSAAEQKALLRAGEGIDVAMAKNQKERGFGGRMQHLGAVGRLEVLTAIGMLFDERGL